MAVYKKLQLSTFDQKSFIFCCEAVLEPSDRPHGRYTKFRLIMQGGRFKNLAPFFSNFYINHHEAELDRPIRTFNKYRAEGAKPIECCLSAFCFFI